MVEEGICNKCGDWQEIDKNGLCEECAEEEYGAMEEANERSRQERD